MPDRILISVKYVSKTIIVRIFESAEKYYVKVRALKNIKKITIKYSSLDRKCFGLKYQSLLAQDGNFIHFLLETEQEEAVDLGACQYCESTFYTAQDYQISLLTALNSIGIENEDTDEIMQIVAELLVSETEQK